MWIKDKRGERTSIAQKRTVEKSRRGGGEPVKFQTRVDEESQTREAICQTQMDQEEKRRP